MADEALMTFRFVDSTGSTAPSSGSGTSPPGSTAPTAVDNFHESSGAEGGAAGAADKNQGRNRPAPKAVPPLNPASPSSPAGQPVQPAQEWPREREAGKEGTTTKPTPSGSTPKTPTAFEAATGIAGAANTVLGALQNPSLGIGDIIGRATAIGGAVSKAASVIGSLASPVPAVGAAAVPAAGAASAAGAGAAVPSAGAAAVPAMGIAGMASLAALPIVAGAAVYGAAYQAQQAATRQAAPYSADLARANAEAEVRQIRADIRTANRLGSELARGVDFRSELSSNLQGIRDTLAKPFIEQMNDVTKILAHLTKAVDVSSEKQQSWWDKYIQSQADYQSGGWWKWAKMYADSLPEPEKQPNILTWFERQPIPAPEGWNPKSVNPVTNAALGNAPGLKL